MVIISKTILNQFFEKYPAAAGPILEWYIKVKQADWADFSELRSMFPATDYVGNDLYIFNIGGRKYRLIARIFFSARTIFIRFVGTHEEYNKVTLSNL